MWAYDQPDTLYATVHPASIKENWSFSFEARYTVTCITLFRFADTTSASVPQSKDFPGARESASSPALAKNNVPEAFAPRTKLLYHFPSPRVNRRPTKFCNGRSFCCRISSSSPPPKTQIPHRICKCDAEFFTNPASDAATGLAFQSTFETFLSFRLQVEIVTLAHRLRRGCER